jgi:hypothetical protein
MTFLHVFDSSAVRDTTVWTWLDIYMQVAARSDPMQLLLILIHPAHTPAGLCN